MAEVFIPEKAKEWLSAWSRNPCVPVGAYLDGNIAEIAWKMNGKTETSLYEMKCRDVSDFFMPPSNFETRCSADMTYGQVFREYITRIAADICGKLPGRRILFAILVPERKQWIRDLSVLSEYLQHSFEELKLSVQPILIPASLVFSGKTDKPNTLTLLVGSEWTDLIFSRSVGSMLTSVHLGSKPGKDIEHPICVRMNDFVHNSTEKWTELSAYSWVGALEVILKTLSDNGWTGISKRQIVCSDEIWNAVSRSSLNYIVPFSRLNTMSALCIDVLERLYPGMANQKPSSSSGSSSRRNDEKKQSKSQNDDLWEI